MMALEASDLEGLRPLADIQADYLEHHGVLPLRREGTRVAVATFNEQIDRRVEDDLRLLLGGEILWARATRDVLLAAVRRTYGGDATTAESFIEGMRNGAQEEEHGVQAGNVTRLDETALDDLVHQANEAPIVRLVNMLLMEALEARASDIHLEQSIRGIKIRYRIDGVLQVAPAPPAEYSAAVVSRLKIMAELDIAERRLPQDGRIRLRLKDREVDVRVSTLPTLHGESVVLRLLDQRHGHIALEDLGMSAETLALFREAIRRPHGIVLNTGPTGSGKTTTLYAAIDHIRTGREKVLTVEDPVEYELDGVAQVPVNSQLGLTFSRALRALLRQDPDILLVGEIRDSETAEIASHAALTGHLVLSTLHTNDAVSALTRLLNLGLAPYLISSTVEAVLAQRLVRLVCPGCASERPVEREEADAMARTLGREPGNDTDCQLPRTVIEGTGCDRCRGTGYYGRTGVYELLRLNSDVRNAVNDRADAATLKQIAVRSGMETLRDDALRLVRQGLSTPAEILRIVT